MPPPEAIRAISAASIRDSVVSAAERHFARSLREDELVGIATHVIPIHAESFAIPAVLKALESASKHDAVIILYAAYYRSADRLDRPAPSEEPTLEEDHWIPDLIELTHWLSITRKAESATSSWTPGKNRRTNGRIRML